MTEILITDYPSRILIGKSADFYGAMSPKFNGQEVLGPVWEYVMSKLPDFDLPLESVMIGATRPADSDEAANGLMTQFVGVVVSEVPADLHGLEVLHAEGGLHAYIEHVGSMDGLVHSVRKFYEELLPATGYQLRAGFHLEIYDKRFDMRSPESIMTIAAPVQQKA